MDEKINAAMDLTTHMTVLKLSEDLKKNTDEVLISFMKSNTCRMLYDDNCKLWWEGPAVISEEYKREMNI